MVGSSVVVLLLAAAVGALAFRLRWFSFAREAGKVAVQLDAAKFNSDKSEFIQAMGQKAGAIRSRVVGLWEDSLRLTGAERSLAQTDLVELRKKHDRLVLQIRELDEAGRERFENIRRDLYASLEEVERKTDDITRQLGAAG